MSTNSQISAPGLRKIDARRRRSANWRMLAAYCAFFTVALLIFDAMILLSLLP